jgi:hypothetical protein
VTPRQDRDAADRTTVTPQHRTIVTSQHRAIVTSQHRTIVTSQPARSHATGPRDRDAAAGKTATLQDRTIAMPQDRAIVTPQSARSLFRGLRSGSGELPGRTKNVDIPRGYLLTLNRLSDPMCSQPGSQSGAMTPQAASDA